MRRLWRSRPRRLALVLMVACAAMTLSGYEQSRPRPAAGPSSGPPEPPFALLTRPRDFVDLALADAHTIPEPARCYTRWLAISDPTPDERMASARTASLVLNYVGRATTIQRPLIVAGGRLVRVDLRMFWPRDGDLAEACKLWENFGSDPTFSRFLTRDMADFLKEGVDRFGNRSPSVPAPPPPDAWRTDVRTVWHPGGDYHYPDDTGRVTHGVAPGNYTVELKYRVKAVPVAVPQKPAVPEFPDADVIRLDPAHLDAARYAELRYLVDSQAPVVSDRYFKARAITTIKDAKVFRQLFGGLYYELAGFQRSKDPKVTDLDLYFRRFGIGGEKEGAEDFFRRLRGDQRTAIFRSEVTGKPREAITTDTAANREGTGWGVITGDVKDGSVDVGDLPVANLLRTRRDGREAIFPNPNGTLCFAAFNGQGGLVDEVPPDIATARNVPAPHSTRLQVKDCFDCHFTEGSDGWKPIGNDVKRLLNGRLDLFGDLGAGRRAFSPDTFDLLAGRYAGSFEKQMRRARDDVAETTLKATGPWPESSDQADVARVAHKRLIEEFNGYRYRKVYARDALAECGYQVPPTKALETLRALCPPDGRSELRPYGVLPEDPTITALKEGLGVNRSEFALCFGPLCDRVQRQAEANVKAGRPWWGGN